MVQIRRTSLAKRGRAVQRAAVRFLQFVAVAGLVPLLFVVRMLPSAAPPAPPASAMLRHSSTVSREEFIRQLSSTVLLQATLDQNRPDSDVVELDHCRLDSGSNFTAWASPLVNATLNGLVQQEASLRVLSDEDSRAVLTSMAKEFTWELLEMFIDQRGQCDYTKYRWQSPSMDEASLVARGAQLQSVAEIESNVARLAILIVAFQDAAHLGRLVAAVHQPQHYIIIHIEQHAPADFVEQVESLAEDYDNVMVLQFGSILYRTDSVSMIHLRILAWLQDLQVDYDYHIAVCGSVYPLQNPIELAHHLAASSRDVYLGELTHAGQRVKGPQDAYLLHKRLLYTGGGWKLHKRLPRNLFPEVPEWIQSAMQYKTVSGNQAIFSHRVVTKLLESRQVKELFAKSKYGCCCCLEERNWIAALDLIGHGSARLDPPAVFQAWGGVEECQSSMNNALLSQNASLCYRDEDATDMEGQTKSNLYFSGNETWARLVEAKQRGVLFARKFRSDNPESSVLIAAIEEELWG